MERDPRYRYLYQIRPGVTSYATLYNGYTDTLEKMLRKLYIRRHIINIFRDGELQQENNVHFLHVNGVKKPVPYYNLDVIISVGYRVHSPQGVAFRIWATHIIKQYLLHGFVIRQQFADIQRQMDIRLEEHSSRMLMIEKTQARQQEQLDFLSAQTSLLMKGLC